MKRLTRTLALAALTLTLAGPAAAGGQAIAADVLDKAKQSAEDATEWTKKHAQEGWEATKEGAGKAADWTEDKAKKGVDATARGVDKAADWTGDKAKKTQEKSRSLWQRVKSWFSSDDE